MSTWRVNEAAHIDTFVNEHGNVVADLEAGDIECAPGSALGAALAHLAAVLPGDDENPPIFELLEADPEPDPDVDPAAWDSTKATIAEVLGHVDGDTAAAAEALAAEEQRTRPRPKLIAALADIINPGGEG
jgi:hypothetical protein